MRLCRVLFIVALFFLKSEGNSYDKNCFKFDHSHLVNSSAVIGSGSKYAVVNLTHSKTIHTSGPREFIEVWSTSFLLQSGNMTVVELNAVGELPEQNPRELTIGFDGTRIEAAIGDHTMSVSYTHLTLPTIYSV